MQCPGQDNRYWDGSAVFEAACPECGQTVEFFKDDSSRPCGNCGHRILNPKTDFGCAAYCPYATQCLGDLPPQLLNEKQDLLKEQVAVETQEYFGDDRKRIKHALTVARYAEEIGSKEEANDAVLLIAAYLHDIGIKEAERKHNSNAAHHQHQEGPPIARQILTKLAAPPGLIDEVCDIISHHHTPRPEETVNYKCLYDADLIVNLEEKQQESPSSPEHLAKVIEKSFLTATGRTLASKVLQNQ